MRGIFYPYVGLVIILLAAIRGFFIHHLNIPSGIIFNSTAISVVCFGFFSLLKMEERQNSQINFVLKLIKINFFFGVIWLVLSLMISGLSELGFVYIFILFPAVTLLVNSSFKWLEITISTIGLFTAIGVVEFWWIGKVQGVSQLQDITFNLRPVDEGLGRIGDHWLPSGYQGFYHDSANVLVMCGLFEISRSIGVKISRTVILRFLLFFGIIFAIFLTGSVANIVILLLFSLSATLLYGGVFVRILTVLAMFFLLSQIESDGIFSDYLYFMEKFKIRQSDLEGNGLFNSLDSESIVNSTISVVFGGGHLVNTPLKRSEIAFVKLLISFGILPFMNLMAICFSPIFLYFLLIRRLRLNQNFKITCEDKERGFNLSRQIFFRGLPILGANLTLLHYGSLFRITSIGIYCVLMALFYKNLLVVFKVLNRSVVDKNQV
jgi:hypothetical protein